MNRKFHRITPSTRFFVVCDADGTNAAGASFRHYKDAEAFIESLGVGHERRRFFITETIVSVSPAAEAMIVKALPEARDG